MGVQIWVVNNFTVGKLGKCVVGKLFFFNLFMYTSESGANQLYQGEKTKSLCLQFHSLFFYRSFFNIFPALLNNEPNLWMGHILAKLENIRKMAPG
jgi:hypothetical protein